MKSIWFIYQPCKRSTTYYRHANSANLLFWSSHFQKMFFSIALREYYDACFCFCYFCKKNSKGKYWLESTDSHSHQFFSASWRCLKKISFKILVEHHIFSGKLHPVMKFSISNRFTTKISTWGMYRRKKNLTNSNNIHRITYLIQKRNYLCKLANTV